MTPASDRFSDLQVRFISGAVIAVVGLGCIWAGGMVFLLLITGLCGVLIWELAWMLGARFEIALSLAVISTLSFLAALLLPPGVGLPFVLLPAIATLALMKRNRGLCMLYTALILVASFGLSILRQDFGFVWMFWLALVVIATDICGYFAGRLIGGPKFWPRVSPKKTWSGTVAGWIAAAVLGLIFAAVTDSGSGLVGISVAISMASQIGDIAESAMKRKMQLKDSSNLIPGHGGVFDRFDGMLGASVFLLLVEQLINFPPSGM